MSARVDRVYVKILGKGGNLVLEISPIFAVSVQKNQIFARTGLRVSQLNVHFNAPICKITCIHDTIKQSGAQHFPP